MQTSTACAIITIQNDEIFENEEAFFFSFSSTPSQQAVSVNTALMTVTIQDDDGKHVVYSLCMCQCRHCWCAKWQNASLPSVVLSQ